MSNKITIEISQTIRVRPYETIKPSIAMDFDLPKTWDEMDEKRKTAWYRERYKDVKKIWNLHLYNLLYDTSKRHKAEDVFEYAQDLVLGEETFPTFKKKRKQQKEA